MIKDIPGYEGVYGITKNGVVYSYKRDKEIKFQLYKSYRGKRMIPVFQLSSNGLVRPYNRARLLAITFIPNPNNYPQVNHKDGNPFNDNLDNLEWCTQSQNVIHAYKNNLMKPQRGKRKNTNGEQNIHLVKSGKYTVQIWYKSNCYQFGLYPILELAVIKRDFIINKINNGDFDNYSSEQMKEFSKMFRETKEVI